MLGYVGCVAGGFIKYYLWVYCIVYKTLVLRVRVAGAGVGLTPLCFILLNDG